MAVEYNSDSTCSGVRLGLFPNVTSEVTFRLALLLALLQQPDKREQMFKDAKAAYNLRCKIAHGAARRISRQQWNTAWELLMETVRAILERNALPDEDG